MLSLVSLFLVLKAMYATLGWIKAAEKDRSIFGLAMSRSGDYNPTNDPDWRPSLWDKFSMFNPWHLLSIVASFLAVIGAIMTLLNASYVFYSFSYTNIVLGLTTMAVWSCLAQYLAYFPKLYTLIASLRRALPNVIRFSIGALPFLIGYALCGTILFGSYSRYFRNLGASFVTLFAAANGDALHDTFDQIYGHNPLVAWLSRVYMVTYIVLFTYTVLNIFIIIVEDSFYTVKEGKSGRGGGRRGGRSSTKESSSDPMDEEDLAEQRLDGLLRPHMDGVDLQSRTDEVILLRMMEKIGMLRSSQDKTSRKRLLNQIEHYLRVLQIEAE